MDVVFFDFGFEFILVLEVVGFYILYVILKDVFGDGRVFVGGVGVLFFGKLV